MNIKNIAERVLWTFIEGFLGMLIITPEIDKAALIAAIMAGIAAVKNVIMEVANKRLKELGEGEDK